MKDKNGRPKRTRINAENYLPELEIEMIVDRRVQDRKKKENRKQNQFT